jgi:hypothetical protein
MKKIIPVILLLISTISNAAQYKVDPFEIVTSAPIKSHEILNGPFKDVHVFQVGQNVGGSASFTNSFTFNLTGKIENFRAVINNTHELLLSVIHDAKGTVSTLSGVFSALSSGPNDNHFLQISGNAINASYGGNININPVGAVPVPAAVWLFGSAFAGLLGLTKRSRKRGI